MKSCKEIMKLASDKIDRELSVTERLTLSVHLALCGACREAAKMLQTIHETAESCCESDGQLAPSEGLSEESRTRIILELGKNVDE